MEEVIRQLILQHLPLTLDVAKVIAVEGDTCDVESISNEKDYFNCRINAIEANQDNYLKVIPAIGSTVIIGIFKDTEKAFIISVSESERIQYKQGKTYFEVDKDGYNITRDETNFKDVLNSLLTENKKLCEELNKVKVSIGVTPNVMAITEIKNKIDGEIREETNKIFK